jgi:hypothetical protein
MRRGRQVTTMSSTPDAAIPPPPPPPAPTPPPPGWTASPSASSPPAAKPMAKMGIVAAVVVIVVIAAVVGGLYAAHIGPFASSSSGPGGGASGSGETYSQAAAAAQPTTSSVSGGPWTLSGGAGVVVSNSVAINATVINATSGGGGCGTQLLSGASSITSIPGTSSSPSSGTSNAWIVYYSNATSALLEVAVFGGTATPLLTQGEYGGCLTGLSGLGLPANYVDSPAAATTAYNAGGSSFVTAHPSFNLEEILVPSVTVTYGGYVTTTPASWEISYTDCNLAADDGTTLNGAAPAQFTASVNATTGGLVRGLNATTACPSLGPSKGGGGPPVKNSLANVTEYFTWEQQHMGHAAYWNNGSFYTTLNTLTTGDLTVSIENNTTDAAVSTAGMTLQVITSGGSGYVFLSTYNFTTNTWNDTSVGIGTASSATNILTLNSTSSLKGDNIVLTATNSAPATGSVSAALGKAA